MINTNFRRNWGRNVESESFGRRNLGNFEVKSESWSMLRAKIVESESFRENIKSNFKKEVRENCQS